MLQITVKIKKLKANETGVGLVQFLPNKKAIYTVNKSVLSIKNQNNDYYS